MYSNNQKDRSISMDNLIRAVLKKSAEEMYISSEQKRKLLLAILAKYFSKNE